MLTPLTGQLGPLSRRRRPWSVWTPASLPGLKLWLKADSLALSDGDPVAIWPDLSGNGNDLTGAGAARPTYRAAVLNGKSVARFAGAQALANATPFVARTILYVASIADGVPYGNTSGVAHYFGVAAGTHFLLNDGNTGIGVAPLTGSFRCFTGTIGASLAASSVRFNGVTQAVTVTLDNTWADVSGPPTVGHRGDAFFPFTGDLAEIAVYDTALAGADRALAEAYLSAKYALGF